MTTQLADDVGFEEEPVADAAGTDTPAPAENGAALVIQKNLSRVKTALADLDRVESELPAVEQQFPKDVIYEVTTTKGMKAAVEHRAAWRDRRITVEKARAMAKAPILELGRTIDARAKRLTEQLRAGEEPIDQLIKAEEQRKEDERQARINAEAGRVLAIQEALAGIGEDVLIACGKASADIQALIDRMTTTQPDPLVFQEQIDQARAAWAAALVKLDTALKAKRWEEAEAKRIADERAAEEACRVAEQERLARVAAEQEQAARALAEERAQLARERAELEALRAAQVPAPVPPAPAPEPAPADPIGDALRALPVLGTLVSAGGPGSGVFSFAAAPPAPVEPLQGAVGDDFPKPHIQAATHIEMRPGVLVAIPKPDTRPPISTGALNELFGPGFTMTAQFINALGFQATDRPAGVKSGVYWRACDVAEICDALISLIQRVKAAS